MSSRLTALFFFLEAIVISAIVRFTLSFLSPTILLRWMGKAVEFIDEDGEVSLVNKQAAARVKLAVTRVDRYMPWGTECYTQALTAKLMLGKRKVSTLLVVGFRKDEAGEIQGHAWLKIGPYYITGFRHDIDTYVINGRFE